MGSRGMMGSVHHHGLMGTRSRIGLRIAPDQIISVYCHYDGYIQNNGRILQKHYKTKEAVQRLDRWRWDVLTTYQAHLGFCATKIIKADGTKEVIYMEHPDGSWMMDIEKEEEGPQYYTERGEEVEIMVSTFDEFLDDTLGEEWCYLFSPGWGWQCWKLGCINTNHP